MTIPGDPTVVKHEEAADAGGPALPPVARLREARPGRAAAGAERASPVPPPDPIPGSMPSRPACGASSLARACPGRAPRRAWQVMDKGFEEDRG